MQICGGMLYKFYLFLDTTRITIADFGQYHGWSDGTFASSCEIYRYPPRLYYYEGNVVLDIYYIFIIFLKTGNGVYKLKTASYEFNAYCVMDAGFDGYTSYVIGSITID